MLVLNSALGKALAVKLAGNPVVLMRASRMRAVVGRSIKEATVRTLYTNIDARAQAAAKSMGPDPIALDGDAELATNARRISMPIVLGRNYRQRMPESPSAATLINVPGTSPAVRPRKMLQSR